MTNISNFDKPETESFEVYTSYNYEPEMTMRLADNLSQHMKTFNSGERKRAVKKAGFKKGKYSWVNK